jgi:signal transduction histidine kinase
VGVALPTERAARRHPDLIILLVADDAASLDQALKPAARLGLYRIAQEALSNATQHSRAGTITVRLSRQRHELILAITDDGTGLPAVPPPGRLGIPAMRARAELHSGTLVLYSAQGQGTTVTARLPARRHSQPAPVAREVIATASAERPRADQPLPGV